MNEITLMGFRSQSAMDPKHQQKAHGSNSLHPKGKKTGALVQKFLEAVPLFWKWGGINFQNFLALRQRKEG